MPHRFMIAGLACATLLTACSPALDWRELGARLDGDRRLAPCDAFLVCSILSYGWFMRAADNSTR